MVEVSADGARGSFRVGRRLMKRKDNGMSDAGSDHAPLRQLPADRSVNICGKNGVAYIVRPISPKDAPSLMRGYDGMSDQAKWFRMLNALPHLSPEMARRFCSPDPKRDICLVIEGQAPLAGEILGGARIAGDPDGRSAEFSVSLRPEAQGLGLGHHVLDAVLRAAYEMGYERAWGLIAVTNTAMLALARRIGFDLNPDPWDHTLVRAELGLDRFR
jgi:acetyltransferase